MRTLVVSDVHGNSAALEAVVKAARGPFDAVLCLGDLVDYGPDPACCVNWVMRHATHAVRGNHDHGAAQDVDIVGVSGFRFLTMSTRRHTRAHLAPEHLRYLADLPTTKLLALNGQRLMMVHASPRDPMDEYVPNDPEAWAARLNGLPIDLLFVGHTHLPFTLAAGRTTVVNPGSVGLPRDGNTNARYALLEDGVVTLHEVEYDIERTVAAVMRAPLDPVAQQMLCDVYRQGRYVHPPGRPQPAKICGYMTPVKPQ